jgi:inner membrane protein
MDPVSHAVFGAGWAQTTRRGRVASAGLLGAIAALAPDLDILIRSTHDPLLALEYHRHFTHSLVFSPVGALLCALVLHRFVRTRLSFREAYLCCLLGYASHCILDACTSYGTQLLWPFSDVRVAWSIIAVVDPLWTVPVVALVVFAGMKRSRLFALAALGWAFAYLALAVAQQQRAASAGADLAASRGHEPVRLEVKPSLGNVVLWKIIYEHDGRYFVDAVRTGLRVTVFAGASTEKLDLDRHLPWLAPGSRQARDVERFRRVSNDFLAPDDRLPGRIVDMRYSMLPNEIDAFWAIQLDPSAGSDSPVVLVTTRERAREQLPRLLRMLFDEGAQRPVP